MTIEVRSTVESGNGAVGPAPPDRARRCGPPHHLRDLDRSGLAVVALLVVLLAVPWAHSIWQAKDQGYRITGDHALISLRARDVFSANPPLIGQPSTADMYSDTNRPSHPGPIEFYFLSVPQRLLGPETGAYLGATVFSLGSVLIAAWVVFRRAGPMVGLLGAFVLSFISFAEGPAVLYDILSSNVGGIPLVGLAVLAWAVLDGDVRMLPLAALSFSFVAQQHLAILGMGLGMGVWVTIGVVRYLLRWRWRDRLPEPAPDGAAGAVDDGTGGPAVGGRGRRAWLVRTIGVPGRPADPPLRWLVAALAVGFVAWLPVLIDAVVHDGGNLRKILGFGGESDRATLGLGAGLTQMLRAVGAPPLLTRSGLVGIDMHADISAAAIAVGLLVLALLAAITCWAWRSRPALATLALTALALAAVGVVNGSQVPDSYEATRINFYRWMYVSSVLTWLTLLWAAAAVIVARRPEARAISRRVVAGATVLAVAVMAVLSSVGRDPVKERDERFVQVARRATQVVPAEVDGDGKRILLLTDGMAAHLALAPALALQLERDGHEVVVPADMATAYGDHRVVQGPRLRPRARRRQPAPGGSRRRREADLRRRHERRAPRGDRRAAEEAEGRPVEFTADAETVLDRVGIEGPGSRHDAHGLLPAHRRPASGPVVAGRAAAHRRGTADEPDVRPRRPGPGEGASGPRDDLGRRRLRRSRPHTRRGRRPPSGAVRRALSRSAR